jgi:ABC-type uncharacterized transport system auxiliary subunit
MVFLTASVPERHARMGMLTASCFTLGGVHEEARPSTNYPIEVSVGSG